MALIDEGNTFPTRAALHILVTLAEQAMALLLDWPVSVHFKAETLRHLGCLVAALKALEATRFGAVAYIPSGRGGEVELGPEGAEAELRLFEEN